MGFRWNCPLSHPRMTIICAYFLCFFPSFFLSYFLVVNRSPFIWSDSDATLWSNFSVQQDVQLLWWIWNESFQWSERCLPWRKNMMFSFLQLCRIKSHISCWEIVFNDNTEPWPSPLIVFWLYLLSKINHNNGTDDVFWFHVWAQNSIWRGSDR